MLSKQRELDEVLKKIESNQHELSRLLENVERSVETQEPHIQNRDDNRRQITAEVAESINNELNNMGATVDSIMKQLNSSNINGDQGGPLSQIVEILNSHFQMLEWAENNSEVLERKLRDATGSLREANGSHYP